ncbi:hypothetical protein M3Y98_00917600 [Aphelenchoides besseyi]|nr:hypothetical protein M3Y98_00917600 [Aphelenchoides besseyi]
MNSVTIRIVILVSLFVVLIALGHDNNTCIEPYSGKYNTHGFEFTTCINAQIEMSWRTNFMLGIFVESNKHEKLKLKLIINDFCKLDFKGENNTKSEWKLKVGNMVVNGSGPNWWGLMITTNGSLLTLKGEQDVGCSGQTLRNKLDEEWVRTKIRIEDAEIPPGVRITVVVSDPNHNDTSSTTTNFPSSNLTKLPPLFNGNAADRFAMY